MRGRFFLGTGGMLISLEFFGGLVGVEKISISMNFKIYE